MVIVSLFMVIEYARLVHSSHGAVHKIVVLIFWSAAGTCWVFFLVKYLSNQRSQT
jgi:hypothetical protein